MSRRAGEARNGAGGGPRAAPPARAPRGRARLRVAALARAGAAARALAVG